MKVGVIGLGYVGSACESLFKDYFDLNTFDINKPCNCSNIQELTNKSDIIFICLPTPMRKDRSCDLSIIESVLEQINDEGQEKYVVIKSTVEVGTTDRFSKKYNNLVFIFNPEFLTEANFIEDFKNQDRIIIGSHHDKARKYLTELYRTIYSKDSEVKIETTIPVNAEMVKYVTNSFLAVKVSYANEIYELCKNLNADYDEIIKLATLDRRLGDSHWEVPGPDGKFGFGGSCFPKDINSLINTFKVKNIDSYILNASWKRNITKDRPEKDWESLKGRAVSKDDQ
jgi:nucleotide sugar dehydrogenase